MTKLEKITISESQLQVVEDFHSVSILISDNEINQLIMYQKSICNKLEWIELSQAKLSDILHPFIYSKYLPRQDYLVILKKVIFSFYSLRVRFDYHTSDETIIEVLSSVYNESAGLQINHLYSLSKKQIEKSEGEIYIEQFDTLD